MENIAITSGVYFANVVTGGERRKAPVNVISKESDTRHPSVKNRTKYAFFLLNIHILWKRVIVRVNMRMQNLRQNEPIEEEYLTQETGQPDQYKMGIEGFS